MVKGNEAPRRNNGQGGSHGQGSRNHQDHGPNKENASNRESAPHRENFSAKNSYRDRDRDRDRDKDNAPRQNFSNQSSQPRYSNRMKAEETLDDIKADISRIEKEIQLEIKEIKSMRLGL